MLNALRTFFANLTKTPDDKISTIPPEIKLTILELLDDKSLKNMSLINSEMHQLSQTPNIKNWIDEQKKIQKTRKKTQFIHTLFQIGDLNQDVSVEIKRNGEEWTLVHQHDGYSFYKGNWIESYSALQASNIRYSKEQCTENVLNVLNVRCTINIECNTIDLASGEIIDEIAQLFQKYKNLQGVQYYKDEDNIKITIQSDIFFASF